MNLRRLITLSSGVLAIVFSAAPVATASAAAPAGPRSCFFQSVGDTISVESCRWNVTVWRHDGCMFGYFKAWNQHNPAQSRNSEDREWCTPISGSGKAKEWVLGAPWSNDTCATFFRALGGGRYEENGSATCNHDS